jgi:hypothetical protein
MCQMCDEYENELVRMGLIEDAKTFREERQREHEATEAARQREGENAMREAAQGSRK